MPVHKPYICADSPAVARLIAELALYCSHQGSSRLPLAVVVLPEATVVLVPVLAAAVAAVGAATRLYSLRFAPGNLPPTKLARLIFLEKGLKASVEVVWEVWVM